MPRTLSRLVAAVRRVTPLALVLLTGVGATLAAWLYVHSVVDRQLRGRFDGLVDEALESIQVRMDAYVTALRGARGLFLDGVEPGRRAFAELTASLELPRAYPGIQGIGFAKFLRPEEKEAHELAVRAEGFPGFRVWPPEPREVYTAITYLEPFDWRNQRAFGFDMYSEPVRREAMTRARDTGEPAATGKVELVQEAGRERQAGFLVYLGVYARPAASAQERREALTGWVYAPFRATDLLRGTLEPDAERLVDLEIFDGDAARDERLLFDGNPAVRSGGGADPGLHRVERLEIAGRTWRLEFDAVDGFVQVWERWLPRFVLAAGLLLTALLVWITRAELRALSRAEAAGDRAAFLAEAGKILGASLDYPANLERLAALVVDRIADGCAFWIEEPGEPLVVTAHRRPGLTTRLQEVLRRAGPDAEAQYGPSAVMRTRRPELLNDLHPDRVQWLQREPELRELTREAGTRHVLTVPLLLRGEPLGAITLVSAQRRRRFGADDVALGEDLARRAASAVDAGRLYRRSLESLRLRDEFLSIASHELKTPLTSLTLQSESLRASAGRTSPEAVVRKAETIRRNVSRLARLVETLLDLSRISAGRLQFEREDVDLVEIVRDVVARFEDEARRAGCELRVDAPDAVVGLWDRLRLDQVVTNLLANAVKYGPGSPVHVTVDATESRARLVVRDQGIGISEADQRRIFDRFERAVSERHYGGFGLGLWIVRRIVEGLGGTVRVESAPGQGATFTVELGRDRPGEAPAVPPFAASDRAL